MIASELLQRGSHSHFVSRTLLGRAASNGGWLSFVLRLLLILASHLNPTSPPESPASGFYVVQLIRIVADNTCES